LKPSSFVIFGVVFILVTCLNGAAWWRRGQKHIDEEPALAPGYKKLIRGWLISGNLPWIVMGFGILYGGVPTMWHYFSPKNGPFVILFYGTVVAEWIAMVYWTFFRRGAEQLVAHPGLLNIPSSRPWAVKVYILACLAGGVAGLLMMIFGNFAPPR
jgi:hypothetical protein